jgi:hypothetical protein
MVPLGQFPARAGPTAASARAIPAKASLVLNLSILLTAIALPLATRNEGAEGVAASADKGAFEKPNDTPRANFLI